jgi:hypothetical protein
MAGATAAALLSPIGRLVVRAAAVGSLALAASYVVLQQLRNEYPADFIWPLNFERVHVLGLLAVAFLAVDAAVGWLRRGPPVQPSPEETAQPTP